MAQGAAAAAGKFGSKFLSLYGMVLAFEQSCAMLPVDHIFAG